MPTPQLQNFPVGTNPPVEPRPVTFAEKFCVRHGVPPSDYEKEMLRRSLYPAGKLIRLLVSADANYFVPDREFIRGVGKLTGVQGFGAEVWAFTVNPENSRFHRLQLKMRVSAKRVYRHLNEVLRPGQPSRPLGNSVPPM
jgi:hypothetical protein